MTNKTEKLQENNGRAKEDIAKDAIKELECLAEHMPDISDTDARVLALRKYYIQLADEVSPGDAQQKGSSCQAEDAVLLASLDERLPVAAPSGWL